jgi:hypothetical protein
MIGMIGVVEHVRLVQVDGRVNGGNWRRNGGDDWSGEGSILPINEVVHLGIVQNFVIGGDV